MPTFEDLGLSDASLDVVRRKGFDEPTPIQALVIPAVLNDDKDLVGQAQTGTGKTAAFGLPILEHLDEKSPTVQALVLTPTRELAIQVSGELRSLKGERKVSIVPIYGGASFGPQLREIERGIDVVVGTPGRVLDHLGRGRLSFDAIRFLVVDEADEMLDMGFQDELEAILEATAADRRTLLFSATMPREILHIAEKYMGERHLFRAKESLEGASLTDQIFHEMREKDRFHALCRVLEVSPDFYGIVFCRTRNDTSEVAARLAQRGFAVGALHGDFTQTQREAVLERFRRRQIRILAATDVAARGIDVPELTHVVNFAMPHSPDGYIHRIGRTGRAGKTGTAVTLIAPNEYYKLQTIRRVTGARIRKEKLPGVVDVIALEKDRIRTSLAKAIEAGADGPHQEMAHELLEWCDPEDLVATLLERAFDNALDPQRYQEIETLDRKKTPRQERTKTLKLYVTKGRREGLTPKSLSRLIEQVCRYPRRKIRDLVLYDHHGSLTLPAREAKTLLDHFRAEGGRPLVVPFKKRSSNRSGS